MTAGPDVRRPRLVLASASPRRRALLDALGVAFEVLPAAVDETLEPGPIPSAVAALALRKARVIASRTADALVLGADTVVVLDGEALGKPRDPDEARAMLRRLRGRVHEVVTGVAVVEAATGRAETVAVVSRVRLAALSEADIEDYVRSGSPLDKAGAYAIQDRGGALVEALEGSYTNVVGLPLAETAALLRAFGLAVSAPAEPAAPCEGA
ncbi:MAG TPA: Maf family protein [Candidatus Tectomicrobia bacterium]|nr:Maf family protein [Candidatus Tectomicrobia bacterium]